MTGKGRGSVAGILVTHGDLGQELLRTVESILGPQTDVRVHSNAGQSHQTLLDSVERILAEAQGGDANPVVLFVDLQVGSCGHACRLVSRGQPEVLLAYGVNLPMLLEFFAHRGRVDRAELKARMLRKGREAVQLLGWEGEAEA